MRTSSPVKKFLNSEKLSAKKSPFNDKFRIDNSQTTNIAAFILKRDG